MGGFVAIYGPNAENELDLARTMLSRIKHRGPDFENMFSDTGIILGYVGRKASPVSNAVEIPFADSDNSAAVTCDAEIYNAEDFLPEKAPEGTVESKSARAIIGAYRRAGNSCASKLDGQFSFVLFDKGDILAARDPLGGIPLYVADRDELTILASELKALRGLAVNVREFPSGHFYHSPSGFQEYFKLESRIAEAQSVESVCERLRKVVENAVQRRVSCCNSKKGVFLSGGIDSSVIAALVCKYLPGVDSFTVGMENSEDVPYARQVASHVGTNHHEYTYDLNEVLDVLPKVIYHLESFDAPLVRSSIANFIASREARKEVDTILIGEGGDENFGGYHHVKRFKEPADQQREFLRLFLGLHNNGFMRTDRMNWAHSLAVRAPFFDSGVVKFALTIHPELKLYGEEQTEKWILRKAFEDCLPKEVVWRPKKQFARGSGSDDLLTRYAENEISDKVFEAEKRKYSGVDLRWKEEWLYFNMFKEHFGDAPSTLATVGRWYE
ncbi:MAG: asparagine synthase [Candidatus Hydrogenedentota bacterium]|nr:MAG: asparagine synthase [Candidatus Hydrogenedentota bacterium]